MLKTFFFFYTILVGAILRILNMLIFHIKYLLLLKSNFKVKLVKRQSNTVVHYLAKATYFMSSRHEL
jgi:hypothetical protein